MDVGLDCVAVRKSLVARMCCLDYGEFVGRVDVMQRMILMMILGLRFRLQQSRVMQMREVGLH